jgi:hypothetical protein
MNRTIKRIAGAGEQGSVFIVGDERFSPIVTAIERREENLGQYGIVWFDVFAGDRMIFSMNALHVAMVDYLDETSK